MYILILLPDASRFRQANREAEALFGQAAAIFQSRLHRSQRRLHAAQIIGDKRLSVFNGEFKSSLATSAMTVGEIKYAERRQCARGIRNLLFKDKFAMAATRSLQISTCP